MLTWKDWLENSNMEQSQLRSELLNRIKIDQGLRHSLMKLVFGSQWTDSGNKATGNEINRNMVKPELRQQYDLLADKNAKVDQDNLEWMKDAVKRYGWPTISKVGTEASNAAWLLVQHFDTDNDFQKHCLDLMIQVRNDVNPDNIQKLTNRINIKR